MLLEIIADSAVTL